MRLRHRTESFILFVGDISILVISLWVALSIRNAQFVSYIEFNNHFQAFILVWAAWLLAYFIAGLYEKHTISFKGKLPSLILNVQIINSAIAILFFYFIPFFGLTPKTILFIYIAVSFAAISWWRLNGSRIIYSPKVDKAIIVGSGPEMKEVYDEINNNHRYNFAFSEVIDLGSSDFNEEKIKHIVDEQDISVVVIDIHHEKVAGSLQALYELMFSSVKIVDLHKLYEDVFDKIPLSLLNYNWFISNIDIEYRPYDFLKRTMDIILSLPLFIISLPFYVIAFLLIKIDDGGKVFFYQTRIGAGNKLINILKFRSMTEGEEKRVTRVGAFLRKSRIDELPQLWNVLKGDISLIGPRPEMPEYVEFYDREIPYYNVRHLLKPGLSGWAQIHQEIAPKFNIKVEETREKLSYDFYYIKNRSFMLDVKIALQTIKTLFSRSGV